MEKSPEPTHDLMGNLQANARDMIQRRLHAIVEKVINLQPGETEERFFRRVSKILHNPMVSKKVEQALMSGVRAPITAATRAKMKAAQRNRRVKAKGKRAKSAA
jgi:hypothetical protein